MLETTLAPDADPVVRAELAMYFAEFPDPEPTFRRFVMETCGYCRGSGRVPTRPYDSYGAAQSVRQRACEYCDGEGVCEDGDKLLGHNVPAPGPDHAADLSRRGNPAWA